MFSRNILAAGTFVVSASVLIQLGRGKKSSRYTLCARDNVANRVFPDSESSVGTYSANDPCEDRNDFHIDSKCQMAAVFDGHGGREVSEFASYRLISALLPRLPENFSEPEMDNVTIGVFSKIEQSYMDRVRQQYEAGHGSLASVGSCVCVAIAKGDRLTIANCGDCRAVLGSDISQSSSDGSKKEKDTKSKFVATRLSRDHNARIPLEVLNLQEQHPDEQKADVVRCHTNNPSACYVKGRLQLTRSLGDLYLKHEDFNARPGQPRSMGRHIPAPYSPPYVSHIPDMTHIRLDKSDKFVILATDGLWDYLTDEEAVAVVADCVLRNDKTGAGSALVTAALERASEQCGMTLEDMQSLPVGRQRRSRHDDTTALVMWLK